MAIVKSDAVNRCIREAAREAAAPGGLSEKILERFLRTGDRTWNGAGSCRFTLAQFKEDEEYTRASKTALRTLLSQLGHLLPEETRAAPSVSPEAIRRRIEPMVNGLVLADQREAALREIVAKTFVLNFQGAKAAIEAELSTCFTGSAWRILWAFLEDHGLKPKSVIVGCDGLAGDFAHVRWSAYETKDPYSDVVVHEGAHMLHYLKPRHYGLRERRGQERFVDVEFAHRELFAFACETYSRVVQCDGRSSRVAFAEKMREGAFSFPRAHLDEVADLVLSAARVRNGWRVIREATEIPRTRRRAGPST